MQTGSQNCDDVESIREVSIDYLRATLTLLVIAHHSALAYTTIVQAIPSNVFDSAAPVVDQNRWALLDYLIGFNDTFFMSLMFFISGLFVLPGLRRHKVSGFLRYRSSRLGLPFIVAVTVLMPAAYYAPWQLNPQNMHFTDYCAEIVRRGLVAGPAWFLWMLLLFDCVVALTYEPCRTCFDRLSSYLRRLAEHPVAMIMSLLILIGVVFVPMVNRFGFFTWGVFIAPPFVFQLSRIFLYAIWFILGCLVGDFGIGGGPISRDGPIRRHWKAWTLTGLVATIAFLLIPKSSAFQVLPLELQGLSTLALWILCNVACCIGFVSVFGALVNKPSAWMTSLARSAYVAYLVHYLFVLWAQRIFINAPMSAALKFITVFVVATGLSWAAAVVLLRVPFLRRVL